MKHEHVFTDRVVCDICGLTGYDLFIGVEVILVPSWVTRAMGKVLKGWLAITLGKTIFAARRLSEDELDHELVHVDQWREHGWTFPFRYAAASIRAVRSGGDWYRDNEFEVEARG